MAKRRKLETPPALMGLREYARHRGVTLSTVQTALASGRIEVKIDRGSKKIEVHEADRSWGEATDPRKQNNKGKKGAPDKASTSATARLQENRAEHEALKVRKTALDLEIKTGSLVPAADVTRTAFDLGRDIRDALLLIPQRIAPEVAAETSPQKVERLIEDEIRKSLEMLADQIEKAKDKTAKV